MSEQPIDMSTQEADAQRAFDKNKARVESGQTFRAQKPRTWQPSKSPSDYNKRSR